MPIQDSLFSSQLDNMQRALDRTTQRNALLTQNLANVNTPGYKRKDIDFDIVLDGALAQSQRNIKQMQEQQAQMLSDQTSLRADGNNVDMEKEVASISETQLRYQALTELASNYFSQISNVIKGAS